MNLPASQIEQLIPQRIDRLLARLRATVWEKRQPVEVYGGAVNEKPVGLKSAKKQPMARVMPGEYFGMPGGDWQQRWFRVDVPPAPDGDLRPRTLHFDCDGETTVWTDEGPWAGLDVAHRHCTLPDQARSLWLDCGTYATGIWLPGSREISPFGCQLVDAWIGVRNEDAWHAYHDVDALASVIIRLLRKSNLHVPVRDGHIQPFERAPVLLRKLLTQLDFAADAYDSHGLDALRKQLSRIFKDFKASGDNGNASLVGHAHLDLVWLWPESITERKAIHTFATVLRLMERYPEFVFTQSQPALYESIRKRAPEQLADIEKRVKQQRWEVTGGLAVESDVTLPSGEGLARSLLYGQIQFESLRGSISRNLWLPDVFGYSNCLPQLCILGGLESFFTTKLTWSAITRFPYSSFRWRSPDGSEILAHLSSCGYHGSATLDEITQPQMANRQAGIFDEVLLPTGFGDGAGGPTEDMCKRARRFKDLAGAPKTSWTRVEDFFDRLDRVRDDLPVFEGELYLECHRGTFTTQGRVKLAHRSAEKALLAHEAVRVASCKPPLSKSAWSRTVFAQFHDAVPGSSIAQVYDELNSDLESVVQAERKAAVQELTGTSSVVGIFNPIALDRDITVELPTGAWQTPQGVHVAVQDSASLDSSLQLARLHCPALSSVLLRRVGVSHVLQNTLVADDRRLANGIVDVRFDLNGNVSQMCVNGDDSGLISSNFRIYPDHPANFDAWDIDRAALALGKSAMKGATLRVVENGPVRAVLRACADIGDASRLTLSYILQRDSDVLEVELDIDWKENHRLLKFHVLTDRAGRGAIYGAPFGSVYRPQAPGDHGDSAMWEVPGQRWAAVVDDANQGVAIITEAKYGFSCLSGDLGLSLLRAPSYPDPKADRHRHTIRFAIGAHKSFSDDGGQSTAARAECLYGEAITATGMPSIMRPFSLGNLGGVVPAAVKPCEDGQGYIIRLHETAGKQGQLEVSFSQSPERVQKVDILERPLARGNVSMMGNKATVSYESYEIISLRVQ